MWIGALLLGVGSYVSASTFTIEQEALAQATAIAIASSERKMAPVQIEQLTLPDATSTPTPMASLTTNQDRAMLVITSTHMISTPTPSKSIQGWAERRSTSLQDRRSSRTTPNLSPEPIALMPPDRIVIGSIDLDSSIVPVGWKIVSQDGTDYQVWDVADNAVGWHNTSAYPGGESNIVLSGHNNIRGEVFRDLINVEIGERVLVYVGEKAHLYQIVDKQLLEEQNQPLAVQRENARWIAPTTDARLTMVTCWPYTGNSHRLIVVAVPISPIDTASLAE